MTKARIYWLVGIFSSIIFSLYLGINDFDTLFWIIFFIFIGLLVGFFTWDKTTAKENTENFISKTEIYIKEKRVNVSKSLLSDSNFQRIVFDNTNKQITIFKSLRNGELLIDNINYRSITESQLVENGNTLTKVSRGSQVAGTIIGSTFGSVGAIVGGLSANQTSSEIIKSLELKIMIDDLTNPVKVFTAKDSLTDFVKDSPVYKQLYDNTYEIHKIISLIIKKEDENPTYAI